MNRSEILVIGSLNTDLVASVDRFPEAGETRIGQGFATHCGGKGANQAYAAGALGAVVRMIGQVGTDDLGDAQIRNLSSQGVHTEAILQTSDQPTGTAIIGVESNGENRIVIIPGANGTLTPDHLNQQQALFGCARIVCLQLEIPLDTVAEAIHLSDKSGAVVMLDPAPAQAIPNDWFGLIDFLTPNLSELQSLSGHSLNDQSALTDVIDAANTLIARGAKTLIVKMGSRGVMKVTATESKHYPARAVVAKDTTAAGDCFNGAFARTVATGQDEDQAIRFAIDAATLSVTRFGAQPSLPSLAEVSRFQITRS